MRGGLPSVVATVAAKQKASPQPAARKPQPASRKTSRVRAESQASKQNKKAPEGKQSSQQPTTPTLAQKQQHSKANGKPRGLAINTPAALLFRSRLLHS